MSIKNILTRALPAISLICFLALSSCTGDCCKVSQTKGKCDLKASTTKATQPLRILTIGNSFTRNGTRFLDDIIEADGTVKLIHSKAWIGGSSMSRHLKHVKEFEADPDTGKPYGGKSLKEMLTADKWDIVTIQQLSIMSDHAETYQPDGGELVAYIRKHAPQAEIWLQETWAYRADDTKQYNEKYTQQDMYNNLHAAYNKFAAEEGIKTIIPTGTAFQTARSNPVWQFTWPDENFDYENPVFPNLPAQDHSLCLGWFWRQRTKPVKFMLDTHHASKLGEYLGGCVWFEKLFGRSVIGNSFTPEGTSREDVEFLQKIAHEVVNK